VLAIVDENAHAFDARFSFGPVTSGQAEHRLLTAGASSKEFAKICSVCTIQTV
jgi:hypothetical protein